MTLDRPERRFTGGRERRRQFIEQLQRSLEPTAHILPTERITNGFTVHVYILKKEKTTGDFNDKNIHYYRLYTIEIT